MNKLDRTWANTQVEAMADGSLSGEPESRMRALINSDPQLRAEVERARKLREQLHGLADLPVPRGLGRRLWRIPAEQRRPVSYWLPATVAASLAVVAVSAMVLYSNRGPTPEEIARAEAVQDFALVVAYLQKSTLMARNEVNEVVGEGFLDALALSRGAAGKAEEEKDNGGNGDVD